MEATVVQFNCVADAAFVLVNDKLVIQPKLALRCAGEIRPHEDVTVHVRPEHGPYDTGHIACGSVGQKERTFRAHAQVHCLDNIYERLVLLVFHISAPPASRPRGLRGDLGRLLLKPPLCLQMHNGDSDTHNRCGRRHDALRCDVRLQCIDFTVLGIAKVVDLCRAHLRYVMQGPGSCSPSMSS